MSTRDNLCPDGTMAAPMEDRSDVSVRFLDLIRAWGWEQGLLRCTGEVASRFSVDPVIGQACAGWQAAERGDFQGATANLQPLIGDSILAGWVHVGLALIALLARDQVQAEQHLSAAEPPSHDDPPLRPATGPCLGCVRW